MRRFSLAAALLAILFAAAPARAQTKKAAAPAAKPAAAAPAANLSLAGPTMDNQVSVWGILGYGYLDTGYGLGARYQKILVPASKSFLKLQNGIRDEIGIEGGIDFVHYSYGFTGYDWTFNEFSVVVGGTWNFWLNEKLAVYPKIDLGIGFGSWSTNVPGVRDPNTGGGVFVQGAAGVVYNIDRLALRAEVGTRYLRLGAAFSF